MRHAKKTSEFVKTWPLRRRRNIPPTEKSGTVQKNGGQMVAGESIGRLGDAYGFSDSIEHFFDA